MTQSVSGGVPCVFFFVDGGVVAVAVVVSDAFSGVLGAARVSAEFALPSAEPSCATKSSILYRSRLSASRVSSGGIVHVRDEPRAPGDGVVRHAVPGPRLRRALVDDSAPSPRGPVVDGEHHEGGERDDGREELGDATSVLDVHESHGRVQKRLRLGGAARRRTRGSHLECGVERGCWTRFYGVLRC